MIDLILDVESTCEDEVSWQTYRSEVIEIGVSVPLGSSATPTFNGASQTFFVRPVIHPTLSDFCKNLTTIQQSQVDDAPIFKDTMADIDAWCQEVFGKGVNDITWASWGFYDLNILSANARWLQSEHTFNPARHVNIKEMARRIKIMNGRGLMMLEKETKRGRFGLMKALEYFNLAPFQGTLHRGVDDAINIGRIWDLIQPMFDEGEIRRHIGHSSSIYKSALKKMEG